MQRETRKGLRACWPLLKKKSSGELGRTSSGSLIELDSRRLQGRVKHRQIELSLIRGERESVDSGRKENRKNSAGWGKVVALNRTVDALIGGRRIWLFLGSNRFRAGRRIRKRALGQKRRRYEENGVQGRGSNSGLEELWKSHGCSGAGKLSQAPLRAFFSARAVWEA